MSTLESKAREALTASDESTRPDRAQRLAWTAQFSIPGALIGRMEPPSLLEEARVCYVNGVCTSPRY